MQGQVGVSNVQVLCGALRTDNSFTYCGVYFKLHLRVYFRMKKKLIELGSESRYGGHYSIIDFRRSGSTEQFLPFQIESALLSNISVTAFPYFLFRLALPPPPMGLTSSHFYSICIHSEIAGRERSAGVAGAGVAKLPRLRGAWEPWNITSPCSPVGATPDAAVTGAFLAAIKAAKRAQAKAHSSTGSNSTVLFTLFFT